MARAARDLNRYPDGGVYKLHAALAERHDVGLDEVCVGAGADGCIDMLSQALLDPGDEIVCGWPSFPSYVIYALKQGAATTRVPLLDQRYDLDALLGAVTPSTKIVYVCQPNNPTGTMSTREELDAYFDRVPEHVVTVVDQAYFEYIDQPGYDDAIERLPEARPAGGRSADVLEDLRARRPEGRLRRRSIACSRRDGEAAAAVRPYDAGAGRRRREHRR